MYILRKILHYYSIRHVYFKENTTLLQYLACIFTNNSINKEEIANFTFNYWFLLLALFSAKIITTLVSMRGQLTKTMYLTFLSVLH